MIVARVHCFAAGGVPREAILPESLARYRYRRSTTEPVSGEIQMKPELEARLQRLVDFPSPAGVAAQVVNLASDPEVDIQHIAAAVSADPALAAKLLRTANSPYYGRRRESKNLREAVMVLGLNATITLALGFSLVKLLNRPGKGRVDYPLVWRRALLSAIAADSIAHTKRLPHKEEIFLASLLQDVGILALDHSNPGFYADLPKDADHEMLKAYEREKIDADHAQVGAWLLRSWNIPPLLCDSVEQSHLFESIPFGDEVDFLIVAVGLSGLLCDALVVEESRQGVDSALQYGLDRLQITDELLDGILQLIRDRVPEIEALFEMSIIESHEIDAIMTRAREVLLLRNMHMIKQHDQLKDEVTVLKARTARLERVARTDPLTSVFDRGYLDEKLQTEFDQATKFRWPLSVLFLDLDRFKNINDKYGHQAGDDVLVATAQLLKDGVRDTDIVGRYGGEEFMVLMPGTGQEGALAFSNRIAMDLRRHVHQIGTNRILVTASIGIATHSDIHRFSESKKLTHAADMALYAAKRRGRDQVVVYDDTEPPAL